MRGLILMLLAGLLLGLIGLTYLRCEPESPIIRAPESLVIGKAPREIRIEVEDAGSGLRQIQAKLRHAGGEAEMAARFFPGKLLSGSDESRAELVFQVDAEALSLPEGEAFLDIAARDWSWRRWLAGNETLHTTPVRIDLRAPRVFVDSGLTYIRRGGAAAVVYSLDEAASRDGVLVGEAFFPGFPFPVAGASPPEDRAGAGKRFALFAIPRDAGETPKVRVIGEDEAGNQSVATFPVRVQERAFEDVRINLPATFLENKVPELADKVGIDLGEGAVAAFQKINTEVRAANEVRLAEIIASSSNGILWRGAFRQMRNSAVTSRFAEHRTYYVSGEQVSEAIHYGYDLASTALAPITAANAGRVVFADELGIYGNCVVLDHGLGLSSLYAHLSRIDVAVGDEVEKSQELGRSGATGLAGGDHLHFAIMVAGTYVDPKEWWDPRWVRDHIEARLKPAP
ncbi:MAG: M23 family metallopeptidase [Myxococcales bacterium]|nr:M23 family metallopeptidase [Myxococcales bacterium]